MKTLILMRHAKSSWSAGEVADHDRALSSRGREAAPRMAAWLRAAGLKPQVILCSTATRVRETLALLRPELPRDIAVRERRHLYMALPREILAEIAKLPRSADCAMVLGHNPGIGSLAHWLTGRSDPVAMARLGEKFPTAAIAVLEFDADSWGDVDGEQGTLRHFVTPKDVA